MLNKYADETMALSWRRKELKMKKNKRYKFVDWNGIQKGLEDTNSLFDAIQNAIKSECEVIDTQTPSGNQIVYSVWDGWNIDYDFYSKDVADFIMAEIEIKEVEDADKKENSFSAKEFSMISLAMLSMIENTDKAFGLINRSKAKEILLQERETYVDLHRKICDMWKNAPDYEG